MNLNFKFLYTYILAGRYNVIDEEQEDNVHYLTLCNPDVQLTLLISSSDRIKVINKPR